jgi:hypothetical protein
MFEFLFTLFITTRNTFMLHFYFQLMLQVTLCRTTTGATRTIEIVPRLTVGSQNFQVHVETQVIVLEPLCPCRNSSNHS